MSTVLISGASRGLGLALAGAFRDSGAAVFSGTGAVAGADEIELNVRSIPSCEKAVRRAVAIDGGIDILINSATVHLGGSVASLDQDAFKETLDINLLGPWRLTKAAVPYMRRGGTIAMISSLSGLVGLPGDGAYAASKFALEGLSQSLAAEVAPLGLRVLLFEPGKVAAEFPGVTDGLAPDIAARAIADAILSRDPPFRNPVGADADRVFEALDVDRGQRAEALVRAVSGCDWQPRASR